MLTNFEHKMETEDELSSKEFYGVPIDKLIDSRKECDRIRILENKNDFTFNEYGINKTELLPKARRTQIYTNDDSDESSVILQDKERQILRRCKIWRRRNIARIDKEVAERKAREKQFIPHTVKENIEKVQFELAKIIDDGINFIQGKCLIFDEKEWERKLLDDNSCEKTLLKVKDLVENTNHKFAEMDDQWEMVSEKEDILVIHEDIDVLRKKSHDILQQKDNIFDQLVKKIELLISQSLNEILKKNDDSVKLKKIIENKTKLLEEEHNKYYSIITELIEEESNKINNKDATEWNSLMGKNLSTLMNSALRRLATINTKYFELLNLNEDNIEDQKNIRIDTAEKNIGLDTELELVKMKCLENIENLQQNCFILAKRLKENDFAKLYKMTEICKHNLTHYKNQIPSLKAQIEKLHKRIDEKEIRYNSNIMKNNRFYVKLWELQKNNILGCIKKIYEIDSFIHEFLGINWAPISFEQPSSPSLLHLKNTNSFLSYDPQHKTKTNSFYLRARDKALNQLILDNIIKTSNFVFEFDIHKVSDAHLIKNISYAYNALNTLKLNMEETWDIMRSKFKPLVFCAVCNSRINWDFNDEIIKNLDNSNEENLKKIMSDNRAKMNESSKHLIQKIHSRLTQHNENIDNVYQLDTFELNDDTYSFKNAFENVEEECNQYSTDVVNNNTPNDRLCANLNHDLAIDKNQFIFVIKEIIKETRAKHDLNQTSLNRRFQKENDFMPWKKNENEVQAYWSEFHNYFPENKVVLWKGLEHVIGRYDNALLVRQEKLLNAKKLKNQNNILIQQENRLCKDNKL